MSGLCDRNEVKRLLDKYGLAPKKGFGQNFLVNPAVPQMIAENSYSLAVEDGGGYDRPHGVIEIGPGVGALTAELSRVYDRVVALEIDRGLIPLLGESLAGLDNIEVINSDVMECDIKGLIEDKFGDIIKDGGDVSVCANLPYYITSPVIMKLLESFSFGEKVPFTSITVMIQTEVADRLAADAGDSDYGAITASVSLRADTRKLFNVSAGNFHPAPKVSSSVIAIIPHGGIEELYPKTVSDLSREELGKKASELITLAFAQRRKTLTNALSSAYEKEKIADALERSGLKTDIRGERLSAVDYLKLADLLSE